jgi:hypothetical protein
MEQPLSDSYTRADVTARLGVPARNRFGCYLPGCVQVPILIPVEEWREIPDFADRSRRFSCSGCLGFPSNLGQVSP